MPGREGRSGFGKPLLEPRKPLFPEDTYNYRARSDQAKVMRTAG